MQIVKFGQILKRTKALDFSGGGACQLPRVRFGTPNPQILGQNF